ncbi:MAG: PIN domain-containing protein [Actinobacteria bacterium]|nr:PIN domain-containing protein [Actinomycetota bacterium]MCG2807237.1 PIN domain-containing protein [Coriobacteriia bacterium]
MVGELVLDAQPVISLLAKEPSAKMVKQELAKRAPGSAVISAVNWCEVLCYVRRRSGAHEAARLAGLVRSLPLGIVNADVEVAGYAAALRAQYGLGLGDCFAAGLALALDAPLLSGDSDFIPLQEHGLKLLWAR